MRQRIDVLLSTVGSKMGVGGHLWCALARWPSRAPLVFVVAAARACARGVVTSIVIAIILDVVVAVPP